MLELYEQTTEYLRELNLISITIRISLSMVCGGVIGIERRKAHQAAGMRTYMLVCMGAALVMMTGQYMYFQFGTGDPSRLGAQVISGIGFLGAGSIMSSGKTKIRGLTTAAGLWTAACIGLAFGIGFYEAGFIVTLAVYLVMTQFKKIEHYFMLGEVWLPFYIEVDDTLEIETLLTIIKQEGYETGEISVGKKQKGYQNAMIDIKKQEQESKDKILILLKSIDGVHFAKCTSTT